MRDDKKMADALDMLLVCLTGSFSRQLTLVFIGLVFSPQICYIFYHA